jgi:hypothetical protein
MSSPVLAGGRPARRGALAGLLILLAACAAALAPSAASAAPIEPGGTYRLVAMHTSNFGLKAMEVRNGSQANGAAVVMQRIADRPSQRWRVEQVGATPFGNTPVYQLVAQHSQRCLDIAGASPDAGAPAVQFTCHGGLNQQFFINDLSSSTNVKTLIARHSGLTLDVRGASTAAGAEVQQFFGNGQANQKFSMTRVG